MSKQGTAYKYKLYIANMNMGLLYRITSMALAVLMLFTSVGFTADVHFCKGELKSVNLFGQAQSCHTKTKSCPHHAAIEVNDVAEKNCCSNKEIEVEHLDTDLNVSAAAVLTDLRLQFVNAFIHCFVEVLPDSVSNEVGHAFLDAEVLLPTKDIYVLLERFLI